MNIIISPGQVPYDFSRRNALIFLILFGIGMIVLALGIPGMHPLCLAFFGALVVLFSLFRFFRLICGR